MKNSLIKFKILLFFCCFLSSKIYGNSDYCLTITGIFPAEETLILTLRLQEPYVTQRNIVPDPQKQEISFLIPREFISAQSIKMQFQQEIEEDIYLEKIEIHNIAVTPMSNILHSLHGKYNRNIKFSYCKRDSDEYIKLQRINELNDDVSLFFLPSDLIYSSSPIGFQLFLRLSFLATLLILIFILTKQAHTQRLPLFSVALFLASLPLKIDYTNYTMGFMILIMVISFIYNKSRRFAWQPVFYALCAMYLMNVVGLAYTDDLKLGIRRLDATVIMILFPVIFSMVQFTQKNVVLLLRFFVWSVIAFCTFGLLSYFTIVPEFTWDMAFKDSKLYAPLLMMWPAHPHPSFLSSILLMAAPIAIYLHYSKIQRFKDSNFKLIETLLGVLLPIVFTVLGGARVGMVIAPVLLILGYLFYCKFKPLLKWGLVVAGIAAAGAIFYLFPKIDDRFADPIRVDLRRTAVSAIKEKPVFGWGTGYVAPLIRSEERAHSLGLEAPAQHPTFHNQYLEDMAQFGIPGICILLLLFGWMLWKGIREMNYLLLSLLVIYMFFCWTETALFISKGCVPFAFWFCFLVSCLFPKRI